MKIKLIIIILSSFLALVATFEPKEKLKLSEYGLFSDPLSALNPVEGVLPYDLNSALFSDYAHKERFVYIPKGKKAEFSDSSFFKFPVGSILVKNFFYYHDEKKPEKGRRILETRLLIHEDNGWKALPYVWNEAQNEAFLDMAGETIPVSWKDAKGKKQVLNYSVPNVNQCKGCHSNNQKMVPIGPTARQLNKEFSYKSGKVNQLVKWKEDGILQNLPSIDRVHAVVDWEDKGASLEARSRAWLDINCGHCHNPHGPANTSGLFLDFYTVDKTSLGFNKTPVAAGRGSGNLLYDIVPGQPEKSILVHRLASTDPGIMMPEIGRQMVHQESLGLIKEWIKGMKE
jgi:uncharacterized repeat protein (TIGR03806 family)